MINLLTPDIKRKSNESLDSYLIRLGDNLELYNLSWTSAAQLLNSEADEEYSESRWRKLYNSYVYWKGYILNELSSSNEYIKELEDKTLEFQKEKVRFQDQKRELNNLIRQQARFEHLKSEIHRSICELSKSKPLYFTQPVMSDQETEAKAIALWSDFHYGAEFKNSFNTYNKDVFEKRFVELINKTIQYGKRHNVSELTVANLGDSISGAIHVSTRVQSGEDTVKQIQHVAEYLAEGLAELSGHFKRIKFINIIGNHSRLISNKTESIFRENLEYIIPWYLESRLRDFKNITIHNDNDGLYIDEVDGEKFVYVHGDLDHIASTAKNLPQVLGFVPKYIFSGHIHHNTVKEHGRTTVISNGSLMGVDDYAISKRFYAKPSQKLMMLNGSDIECTYDIKVT